METLKLKQQQGFRGAYALYEDLNKTIPIDIEARNVEIKLVREEGGDKVMLTIVDADIVKTNNIAAFTVAGTETTAFKGTFKIQVAVDGLDVTDKIISLTPTIIEFSKTY
jgi:hypothetical protein